MNERVRERFVRWEGRTLDQFSFVSNLVLGLSTAALGLSASALLDRKVPSTGLAHWLFIVGFALHAVATIVGLGLGWNRLLDFRKTMETNKALLLSQVRAMRQETKELGRGSWRLLATQSIAFALGILMLLAFVVLQSS
jgi:hypothetical protein